MPSRGYKFRGLGPRGQRAARQRSCAYSTKKARTLAGGTGCNTRVAPSPVRGASASITSADRDMMQSIYDYQEEHMDEIAFLEESHRLCSPEYDDIGCYVHQDGVAMVWDFEHSVYIPYGARASKWPHPIEEFPAPIITNTDLPGQYVSCGISECAPLVEVPTEVITDSIPYDPFNLPKGCELVPITGEECKVKCVMETFGALHPIQLDWAD